jgi:hypothetical protein
MDCPHLKGADEGAEGIGGADKHSKASHARIEWSKSAMSSQRSLTNILLRVAGSSTVKWRLRFPLKPQGCDVWRTSVVFF